MVDISSLKRAEQEKLELETQIRHIQKMDALGTLAGGIAHDFNNILSGIIGYTEIALRKFPENVALRNYLEQVHSSSNRAKNLVQQILTFSQRSSAETAPVRISAIVDEVVSLAAATFQPNIQLQRHPTESDPFVMGDATQLHQVMLNILTNAARAMEQSGGLIDVYIESVDVNKRFAKWHGDIAPGRFVRIVISDTGTGMSEEIKKRIFEPYFTTRRKGDGTGLGLSVCHGIVASHGGTITVWSKPDKGSKFAVYLPQALNITVADEQTNSQVVQSRKKGRILFVDDEPMLAQLGSDMLSLLGYQVASYSNSSDALAAFTSNPTLYDLIVTDLTMPGMSGISLMSEIRRIRPDIPVILSTGYGADSEREQLKGIENLKVLSKPFSMSELGDSVQQSLIPNSK